jgi:hypothetical protein
VKNNVDTDTRNFVWSRQQIIQLRRPAGLLSAGNFFDRSLIILHTTVQQNVIWLHDIIS